jgi:hypothetical protein
LNYIGTNPKNTNIQERKKSSQEPDEGTTKDPNTILCTKKPRGEGGTMSSAKKAIKLERKSLTLNEEISAKPAACSNDLVET